MVNLKFHFYYFALKIISLTSINLPFCFQCSPCNFMLCLLYDLICCLVLHSHTGYYAPSYIFCIKYLSTFSHISSSSKLIILHCWVSYSNNFFLLIRIINLDFTFIFSGVSLKRSMPELSGQVYQTQPLTLGKPWQETEVTDQGRCQYNIST